MSHYTVAVITKDGDWESALAPYSELNPIEWELENTREEIIASLRQQYSKEGNMEWLEKRYDFSSDEALFESYKKRHAGDKSIKFDEEGNEWRGYNPDGKWDWYDLGGRWAGEILRTKDGEPTDHEQVKNLDLSNTKLSDEEFAWRKRFWEINVELAKPVNKDEASEFWSIYGPHYFLEEYGSFEGYIEAITRINTYAFIYNGEWYEPGEMGMFGVSSASLDDNIAYRNKFQEIIQNLDPDDYISIVDCHM